MPLTEENRLGYDRNKQPKCPYCDKNIDVRENEMFDLYDETVPHEVRCPHCLKEILIFSRAVWTFSTSNQDGLF